MFSVGSSRIAVCGQAPVSTASTRSGSISPLRRMRSASSLVTRSLVITASRYRGAATRGISRSISAVLPEPTGPPMPTRAAASVPVRVSIMLVIAACSVAPAAPRGRARRSRGPPSTNTSKVCGSTVIVGTGVVAQHVALGELARAARRQQRLASGRACRRGRARSPADCTKQADSACLAPPERAPLRAHHAAARRSSATPRCRPSRPRR